ncbi:MAG: ATP-binding protein [Candidatus Binatia bacterium]
MTLHGRVRTPSPEHSSKPSAEGSVAPDRPCRPHQDLNVLILEDSPDDAELEASMLAEAGYTCHWERVQTRDEFFACLQEPDYDLILADYSLPAFDGLSALKLLRATGTDVPFILVSGTVGEETAIESLKAGATDYVLKPRLSRLIPVVQRALEERREHRQRQQAEAALRASEAKLHLATTQMPAVLWTTDVSLRVTSSVGAAVPLIEPKAEPHVGSPLYEVFPAADPDSPPIVAHRRALSGQSSTYEQRLNDRVFEVRVEPLRGPDERIVGCLALGVDITERKHAEDEIRRLNAELEQRVQERTAQLEASNRELEAFSYSVSHDLRAPLRVIESFTKAIEEDCGARLDPQSRHYLDRVRAATERTKQLIADLLQLSRVSRSEMQLQRVDMSQLARTVAVELQQALPTHPVTIVIADAVVATCDARLVRVLLDNLLGNAWKFTSKHAAGHIEFGVTERDGERIYFVRDDGAGFDMRFADQLFQPFKRLHGASDFPGTGIGLATVQRIVHRHGGRVWAEGEVEGGATFYFTLAPEPALGPSPSGLRITDRAVPPGCADLQAGAANAESPEP